MLRLRSARVAEGWKGGKVEETEDTEEVERRKSRLHEGFDNQS
jgi:hypothetical protein